MFPGKLLKSNENLLKTLNGLKNNYINYGSSTCYKGNH